MIFNNLVFVNVGSVKAGNCFFTNCNGIRIDWGNWYFKRPFNGIRDINLFTIGGLTLSSIRIADGIFGEDVEKVKVPVYIIEESYENYKLTSKEKVELTNKFKFSDATTGFKLIVKDIEIGAGKDDHDQPFRMIDYKGETSPFGDTVEEWISPYIKTPNRPYVVWRPNPHCRVYR